MITVFFKNIILIIVLILLYRHYCKNLEHMTASVDEAVQNVASIYNSNNMTVSNMNVTTGSTVNGIAKVNVLQLGDKFKMSGVGDGKGNDDWLRLTRTDGNTAAKFAAAELWSDGNLTVVNNTNMNGSLKINGGLNAGGVDILAAIKDLQTNVIRKDKGYKVQSGRGSYLMDAGGWSGNFGGSYEQMYFRESGKCISDKTGNDTIPPKYNGVAQQCSA